MSKAALAFSSQRRFVKQLSLTSDGLLIRHHFFPACSGHLIAPSRGTRASDSPNAN
jgi:hypothetical protein